MTPPAAQITPPNRMVSRAQVAELIARTCPHANYRGNRVLVIVPDGTRTAPVGRGSDPGAPCDGRFGHAPANDRGCHLPAIGDFAVGTQADLQTREFLQSRLE